MEVTFDVVGIVGSRPRNILGLRRIAFFLSDSGVTISLRVVWLLPLGYPLRIVSTASQPKCTCIDLVQDFMVFFPIFWLAGWKMQRPWLLCLLINNFIMLNVLRHYMRCSNPHWCLNDSMPLLFHIVTINNIIGGQEAGQKEPN